MSQPEERGPGRMDRGKPGRRSTVVVCHTRVLSSPQELCTNFKVSTFRHRVSSLSSRGLLVVGQICTAPAPGGRCRQTGQGDLRSRPSACSACSANFGASCPVCVWGFGSWSQFGRGLRLQAMQGGTRFLFGSFCLSCLGPAWVLT